MKDQRSMVFGGFVSGLALCAAVIFGRTIDHPAPPPPRPPASPIIQVPVHPWIVQKHACKVHCRAWDMTAARSE